jgi:hypothetical protein
MSARQTILAGLVAALFGVPAFAQTSSAPVAGATEFQTEADARAHCPAGKLVWANLTSKAYHLSGDRFYGSGQTKKGAFTHHAAAAARKPS